MSVVCARRCGGIGGAAKGPVDRGMSLGRVVVAMWPGRWDGAPCRRRVRIWLPGVSLCLVGYS